jgi:hypothetical protein
LGAPLAKVQVGCLAARVLAGGQPAAEGRGSERDAALAVADPTTQTDRREGGRFLEFEHLGTDEALGVPQLAGARRRLRRLL